MKRFFLPSSLLLYLLSTIVFFLAGTFTAKIAGAGEGQGLAAAAIVLGYGVIAGIFALFAAIIFVGLFKRQNIILANKILALVCALF